VAAALAAELGTIHTPGGPSVPCGVTDGPARLPSSVDVGRRRDTTPGVGRRRSDTRTED
jgi:hypothetical protein